MTLTAIAIIGIVALMALMAIRVPISFGMLLVGLLGIAYVRDMDAALQITAGDLWGTFSSYTLTAIPTFVFMGNIAFKSGLSERLYSAANRWVGHLPGGLAGTTVLASAGFGAICGSGIAATATMGTVALPEMKKYKYSPAFSSGIVAVAGTLGVIIPPSLIMIIVAVTVGESVGKLFLAGIVPGVLLMLMLLALVVFMCWRNPELGPPAARSSWADRFRSLNGVGETALLFALVLGGIYLGWFTPTEAGAAGAFGALVIAVVKRDIGWQGLKDAVIDTARISAMVMLLIAAGVVFGKFMAVTRLPFAVVEWVEQLAVPAFFVLLLMIGIYVVGGMLMDSVAFLVVSLPIFFPVAMSLGYDPIWFLLLITVVTSLGAVTPPVGVGVFVVGGLVPDVPISKIFRGVNVFLTTYAVLIAVMIAFPGLFLFILRFST